MRWPWVSRNRVATYRRLYNEQIAIAAEHRGAREELQSALRRSEQERSDLQMTLLRVGFGYAPFPEPSPTSVAQSPEDQHGPVQPSMNMTEEEVQALFTREGIEKYGGNMRKVKNHVEMRKNEYYANRYRKPILTDAEVASAAAIAADLEAAIQEGRAAAETDR